MKISRYEAFLLGDSAERLNQKHLTTRRRFRTFALSIHIPVMIWLATSLIISLHVFQSSIAVAVGSAIFCAALIFMIERIVLAAPKSWWVGVSRVVLGFLIAFIGASAVDLVIFDREITEQLKRTAIQEEQQLVDREIDEARLRRDRARDSWEAAVRKAEQEADGTGGSGLRSTGPIYLEKKRFAEMLRGDFVEAEKAVTTTSRDGMERIAQLKAAEFDTSQSGLLKRLGALHAFVSSDGLTLAVYLLFVGLMLIIEMTVVIAKATSQPTVDDEIEHMNERISQHKAHTFMTRMISPASDIDDELKGFAN